MGTIFVVAMIALPLWAWISGRLNKRWAYIIGIAFLAVVLMVLSSLDTWDQIAVHYGIVCSGRDRGIGDARHAVGDHSGRHRVRRMEKRQGQEGMFYSLITLAQKVASSIAVPAAARASGHRLCAQQCDQPASAIFGIRLVAGLIPALTLMHGYCVHSAVSIGT